MYYINSKLKSFELQAVYSQGTENSEPCQAQVLGGMVMTEGACLHLRSHYHRLTLESSHTDILCQMVSLEIELDWRKIPPPAM